MNTDLLQNLEYGKVLWINCKIPNKSLQTFTVQNFYEKKTQFMDTANIQLILSAVEMKNNQIYIVYNKLFHSFKP